MNSVNFAKNFFSASVIGPADTPSPNSDVTTNSSLLVPVKSEVYFVQDEMLSLDSSHWLFLCVLKER